MLAAIELGEKPVAVRREPQRVERRQAPDLALRAERIGRRADRHARPRSPRVAPGLGAVRRRADREVAIEARARGRPARRRLRQLPVAQPLQEQVEAPPLACACT